MSEFLPTGCLADEKDPAKRIKRLLKSKADIIQEISIKIDRCNCIDHEIADLQSRREGEFLNNYVR